MWWASEGKNADSTEVEADVGNKLGVSCRAHLFLCTLKIINPENIFSLKIVKHNFKELFSCAKAHFQMRCQIVAETQKCLQS